MYERAWKAVSESPAVFPPLWKVLGVVLLAWTVLNVICYSTVGCFVAGFNPWALRFSGIHVRGKLKIKSIRYNFVPGSVNELLEIQIAILVADICN